MLRNILFCFYLFSIISESYAYFENNDEFNITNDLILTYINKYTNWYPEDELYKNIITSSAPIFWDALPSCRLKYFPHLSEEERKGIINIPDHGVAVITLTFALNSKQQFTFHKYYGKIFGNENIYFGIHMPGHCKAGKMCDPDRSLRHFSFTPMMKFLYSSGSKLIATDCGRGHRYGGTQSDAANSISRILRELGYTTIIFVEDDEFLIPNSTKYPGGLYEYVHNIKIKNKKPWARAIGYNIREMDNETKLDRLKSIFSQRNFWYSSNPYYCKTTITQTDWIYQSGGHESHATDLGLLNKFGKEVISNCSENSDPDLVLAHFKCIEKNIFKDQVFREYAIEYRDSNKPLPFNDDRSPIFNDLFFNKWNKMLGDCGYSENIKFAGYSRAIEIIPLEFKTTYI